MMDSVQAEIDQPLESVVEKCCDSQLDEHEGFEDGAKIGDFMQEDFFEFDQMKDFGHFNKNSQVGSNLRKKVLAFEDKNT